MKYLQHLTTTLLICFAFLFLSLGVQSSKSKQDTKDAQNLTLSQLFPDQSPLGRQASGIRWNDAGTRLLYLWAPFVSNQKTSTGSDIYLYDRVSGKTSRVTSPTTFQNVDRDIPKILEQIEHERKTAESRKSLSEKDRKTLEESDKVVDKDRKEPRKAYAGISEALFSHNGQDILFIYKGDIYRKDISADAKPIQLTRTTDTENSLQWMLGDKGFTFRRGEHVYRRLFGDLAEYQISSPLPDGLKVERYWLSKDGSKIATISSKRVGPPSKQVSYIVYRDRFAEARTVVRDTGDDPDRSEVSVYIADTDPDTDMSKGDGQPWLVYKKAAGVAGDVAVSDEPFSASSDQFVFSAWVRDKRELTVHVARTTERKSKVVFTDTHNGEHRSPSLSDPFFSPDGKRICVMLEKSGFRHAWLIDPSREGASQLTKGDFEVYPLRFSKDGSTLIVRASKEDSSQMDIYRVSVADGTFERWSSEVGRHSRIVLSETTEQFAAIHSSWSTLSELVVSQSPNAEKRLTSSHSPEAPKIYNRVVPRRFTFKNRNGLQIQGSLMLPKGLKDGEKRPLLIYVYGGPLGEDHQVTDGQTDRFGIYVTETLGYIYATIDPRGTSGYGAVFGKANLDHPGVNQVDDLVDGVKWLQGQYSIDPLKVGIHGWSFGGYQTQMCLYTAPETFTLGIAGAGPTEWQNYNSWYVGGVIGANKTVDELDMFSLTKLAKNLRSPLLLLHGLEDTNVLAQDTIKVYRELLKADKGGLVELVLDPTGGHGLGGDISQRQRMQIYSGFLERHWGRVGSKN